MAIMCCRVAEIGLVDLQKPFKQTRSVAVFENYHSIQIILEMRLVV